MASAELSRRVEKIVGYPPLCEMGELARPPRAPTADRVEIAS